MKKLKIRTKVLTVLIMAILIGFSSYAMNAKADELEELNLSGRENFEKNGALFGFDIWINQSVTSLVLEKNPSKYSTLDLERGWTLRHVRFVPETGINMEWKDFVKPEHKTVEFFGLAKGLTAQADTNDPGYFAFADAHTDIAAEEQQDDFLREDGGTIITVNSDYLDDTSEPSANNMSLADSDAITGIKYTARDGKSLTEYARDAAEADGGSLYGIQNSTAIGFAFDSYDKLTDVVWHFDTPTTTRAQEEGDYQPNAGVLKRVRVWLHNKKVEKQASGLLGAQYTTAKTIFKPMAQAAGSGLETAPTGAKYFLSKEIGSAYNNLQTGVGAIVSTMGAIAVGIILNWMFWTAVLIIVIVIIVRKLRKKNR